MNARNIVSVVQCHEYLQTSNNVMRTRRTVATQLACRLIQFGPIQMTGGLLVALIVVSLMAISAVQCNQVIVCLQF